MTHICCVVTLDNPCENHQEVLFIFLNFMIFFKFYYMSKCKNGVKNSIRDSFCKKQVMFSRKSFGGFQEHTIKIHFSKFQAIV